jgi:hypothetical protein
MILAGCAMITNPTHDEELNAANLVYERAGDRFTWRVYKFRRHFWDDSYGYGPEERTHGLPGPTFLRPKERAAMLRRFPIHPWAMTIAPLTSQVLLELFQEAVHLRPSASHSRLTSL